MDTGWLSISTINAIGATRGLHVEEGATDWGSLQAEPRCAAMLNWNNRHWTLLQRKTEAEQWLHVNSIEGAALRQGRRAALSAEDVGRHSSH